MTLTAKDIADLERIESEIEQDQTAFFRMAENLVTIRDRKLYLREYKTFEAYCQTRWGWTRQWVNQQIRSAEVIRRLPEKTLETLVSKLVSPLTESVARAIASVPEAERPAVIEHASAQVIPVDSKSLTASAQVILNASTTPEVPEPPKRKDETSWPIPDCRLDLFKRAEQVTKMLHNIAEIRGFVRKAMDHGSDPLFREFHAGDVLMACDNVHAELKLIVPYAVCPVCQGIKADACKACCFRGVLSKYRWDTAIPEELKRMRQATLADKGA